MELKSIIAIGLVVFIVAGLVPIPLPSARTFTGTLPVWTMR